MPVTHTRFTSIKLTTVALAAAVAMVSGCGGHDNRIPTYPVNGKVAFADGSTIEGAQITFHPVKEGGRSASGTVEADGTFTLTTYETGDGAVAGLHRVVIDAPFPTDIDFDEVEYVSPIDQRFATERTSGLQFTVTEDGPNAPSFLVEPPK